MNQRLLVVFLRPSRVSVWIQNVITFFVWNSHSLHMNSWLSGKSILLRSHGDLRGNPSRRVQEQKHVEPMSLVEVDSGEIFSRVGALFLTVSLSLLRKRIRNKIIYKTTSFIFYVLQCIQWSHLCLPVLFPGSFSRIVLIVIKYLTSALVQSTL